MRAVACPVALHPDGMPRRVPVFDHPLAGARLVRGVLRDGEAPERAAARELYEASGLETRAALPLGTSDAITPGTRWHFALCRVAPPVRAAWQHAAPDDGGHLLRFRWHALDDLPPDGMDPAHARALDWMREALA